MALSHQFWGAFGVFVLTLMLNIISFIMPLWIQSYEPTQSMFSKVGLWEACFVEYTHEDDVEGTVWDGCYSTYRNGKLRDLWEWICPPWFIAVQVLSAFVLIALLVATLLLILYFVRCCNSNMEAVALYLIAILTLLAGFLELVVVITFGVQGDNQDWLPRPDINHFSWSYAFAVLCSLFAFIASALFIGVAQQVRRTQHLKNRELSTMGSRQLRAM